MLLDRLRALLRRRAPPADTPNATAALSPLVPETELQEDDDPTWPSARIALAEALWGQGFVFPGGREETLRLAAPLGLSAASSLLLLGAGSGGPARTIAAELGGWVTGYEANARLVALAGEQNQRGGLGRRAQVETWNPTAPDFAAHYFHHAVAIEAIGGGEPASVLAAVAGALKSGGQFALEEMVADRLLDPAEPMVAHWLRLQRGPAGNPAELAITSKLKQLGFDVPVVEDMSRRHIHYVIKGWRSAVGAMQNAHPTLRQVALLVQEAEFWLARIRMMRAGRLRLVRWHAISRT